MQIAERLHELGAHVVAHDPLVADDAEFGAPIERVECTDDELERADIVVLLVDHPELPYGSICTRGRLVLDTKGVLRGQTFRGEVL